MNEIGYGPYSDIAYVLTASAPLMPNALDVKIIDSNVVITWQMPFNSGSLITHAEVQLKDSTGVFGTELTYCDGNDQAVFDQRQCVIPCSLLRQEPFELEQGHLVSPKIRFANQIGFSEWSTTDLTTVEM